MTIRTSAPRTALFDRLGGFDGIDQAVQRLFAALRDDPALARLLPATGHVDARWQVQMLLTDRFGGPMAYDGPDPEAFRAAHGIGAGEAERIGGHLVAAFQAGGAAAAVLDELRGAIAEAASGIGVAAPAAAAGDARAALIAQAVEDAKQAGWAERALFVLDADLTLVHLNPEAERGLEAAKQDLRRAFGLGPADLPGQSILRFHPAPSQLQSLLHDITRLPKETTWCFGQAVWKARISVVRNDASQPIGYAIAWRDESGIHRTEAVFQRLRNQAEDLPVPIMYPDPMIEKWYGNAACEHALQRLAPYLPFPVNPLDGVPVQLFLPDEQERRAIFRDPARLPYKSQIRMGPETIAILVSPIRDEDQRYLGPQITWEIVHFTPKAERAPAVPRPVGPPPPAVPRLEVQPAPVAAAAPAPAPAVAVASPASGALRGEARALEAAAAELQTLVRLLDLVADQAEGQGADEPGEGASSAGAAAQAEAAIVAAMHAVRRAADEAAGSLTAEARSFTAELQERVRTSVARTQLSAEALGKIVIAANGLRELRAGLAEPIVVVSAPGHEALAG